MKSEELITGKIYKYTYHNVEKYNIFRATEDLTNCNDLQCWDKSFNVVSTYITTV